MLSVYMIQAGIGAWQDSIPEELRLLFPLVLFLVNLLVLAVFLYLAGIVVVGKKRALLTDALIISLLGSVLSTIFFMFLPYCLVALLLSALTWLLLIKRLFKIGWFGAVAVGILSVIIFLAVVVVLAFAFGIIYTIFNLFSSSLLLST
jgi:hypothetical protein